MFPEEATDILLETSPKTRLIGCPAFILQSRFAQSGRGTLWKLPISPQNILCIRRLTEDKGDSYFSFSFKQTHIDHFLGAQYIQSHYLN